MNAKPKALLDNNVPEEKIVTCSVNISSQTTGKSMQFIIISNIDIKYSLWYKDF